MDPGKMSRAFLIILSTNQYQQTNHIVSHMIQYFNCGGMPKKHDWLPHVHIYRSMFSDILFIIIYLVLFLGEFIKN